MKKRIVHSYARFSGGPKQARGDSDRRQTEGAEEFCQRRGFTLSDTQYFDKGKSGFSPNNKQRQRDELLRAIDEGRIANGDILLIENWDRLSRRGITETSRLCMGILDSGVSIAVLSPFEKIYEASDTNNLGSAMEMLIGAFQGHDFSLKLSGRLKAYHAEQRRLAIETGKPIHSSKPPAWLERVGDRHSTRFVVIAAAVVAIRYVFQRTIDGLGAKRLLRELNAKFPALGKSGKWNEQYIRCLLKDRRVLGEYTPCQVIDGKRTPIGKPIANYFKRIIDDKTYELARMATQHRCLERGASSKWIPLFTGIAWNAIDKCPCRIQSVKQLRKGEFVIVRRLKSNKSGVVEGASRITIDYERFETAVLAHLRELDLSIFEGRDTDRMELASLVSQVERKQAKIDDYEAALRGDDTLGVPQALKALAGLTSDLEALQGKVDALRAKANSPIAESLRTIKDVDATSNENRIRIREALKRIVSRIWILPVKLGNAVVGWCEIELLNGNRRIVFVGVKSAITLLQDKPKHPSLADREKLGTMRKAIPELLLMAPAKRKRLVEAIQKDMPANADTLRWINAA